MADGTSQPSLHVETPRAPRSSLRGALRQPLKRATDVALAAATLAFIAPMLLLAVLALRLDFGGPVLVRRRYVGRDGIEFDLLRFRIVNAAGCATRVGAFLHATRMDGLPRLLNVIRGEMSLVGPRPVTQWELSNLCSDARACYAAACPGLTGPWRLAGLGSDTEPQDTDGGQARAALDLPHFLAPSLRADLRVFLRTCIAPLSMR